MHQVSIYSTIGRLVKLGMGCVILLWYSLSHPFNYFDKMLKKIFLQFPTALNKIVS